MLPMAPGAEDSMARLRSDQIMIAKEMVAHEVSVRQVARQLGVDESSLRYRLGCAAPPPFRCAPRTTTFFGV
jgi:hypothetical protein